MPHPRRRTLRAALTLGTVAATVLTASVVAAPALADVPPAYNAGGTATLFTGRAFDGCVTPSLRTLTLWRRYNDYRAFDAYISGRQRACKTQPNLTRANLRELARLGIHAIPIHVGRQAPCSRERARIDPEQAYPQGREEADEAVSAAQALGLLSGTAIYYDMEGYTGGSACTAAVVRALDGWTDRLHQRGYLSGVYSSASSGIRDLAAAYASTSHSRSDALWIARWDGVRTLQDRVVRTSYWAGPQRMKQYIGPHRERHGGVSLEIDSNVASTVLSSVAQRYRVTSTAALRVRAAPGLTSTVLRTLPAGSVVDVSCQGPGQVVEGSRVWSKVARGGWVADAYLSTPGSGYTAELPRCATPYQVARSVFRHPGPAYVTAQRLRGLVRGTLAMVACQTVGQRVGGSRVWDRLTDGSYVPDSYLRSGSTRSYSANVTRCRG